MNITVYHEPHGGTLGGSEVVTAVMCSVLAENHTVTLAHHIPGLSPERLAEFAGANLADLQMRYLSPPTERWQRLDLPIYKLVSAQRRWLSALSTGTDLFVTSTHGVPPFNHAGLGLMYVHFPLFDRWSHWPWNEGHGVRSRFRRTIHESLWHWRMSTYQCRLANSGFSAEWVKRYWGVPSEVVYPPVTLRKAQFRKKRILIVLGRFTESKRQLDLIELFRSRSRSTLKEWGLVCVGARGRTRSDVAYYSEVERAASGSGVRLVPDASGQVLQEELWSAAIYWHGMGLGVDATNSPDQAEHFGISTVEAMSSGCVPIAPDAGGQREIIRDSVDGYLCQSPAEILARTERLVASPSLLATMSRSAADRAKHFSRERFAATIRSKVDELM